MKECKLEEICQGQPCEHGRGYCILKEMVLHDSKYNERLLVQMGCVNRLKYDESTFLGYDIGWKKAWEIWVERGYALKFAEKFNPDVPDSNLYKEIISS